jgi:hypothetical protein
MKLTHLGDALDHWKGSLIELIGGKRLRVVPMFTDRDLWTEKQIGAYARLLHLRPEDVLKRDSRFSGKTRTSYFCDLGEHDLFLDPDTGIAPDDKNAKKEHVRISEIAGRLSAAPSRMLLIYQHASRDKDGLRKKLNSLHSTDGLQGCDIFAYDSGSVSMLVISQHHERARGALACLKSWLGPIAATRIVELPSGRNRAGL